MVLESKSNISVDCGPPWSRPYGKRCAITRALHFLVSSETKQEKNLPRPQTRCARALFAIRLVSPLPRLVDARHESRRPFAFISEVTPAICTRLIAVLTRQQRAGRNEGRESLHSRLCESYPFHGCIHVRESWRIPSSRVPAREVNWLFNLSKLMTKCGSCPRR